MKKVKMVLILIAGVAFLVAGAVLIAIGSLSFGIGSMITGAAILLFSLTKAHKKAGQEVKNSQKPKKMGKRKRQSLEMDVRHVFKAYGKELDDEQVKSMAKMIMLGKIDYDDLVKMLTPIKATPQMVKEHIQYFADYVVGNIFKGALSNNKFKSDFIQSVICDDLFDFYKRAEQEFVKNGEGVRFNFFILTLLILRANLDKYAGYFRSNKIERVTKVLDENLKVDIIYYLTAKV